MTTPSSIPRFLLPRGGLSKSSLERIQAPRRNRIQPSLLRRVNFSSSPATHATPTKPRVLEKPDRFRPPSHPARRVVNPNKMPRNYPGPAPTPKEIAERKTKRYPNMFPPEGTVLYKFLTNKGIHVWISMVTFWHASIRAQLEMLTVQIERSLLPCLFHLVDEL